MKTEHLIPRSHFYPKSKDGLLQIASPSLKEAFKKYIVETNDTIVWKAEDGNFGTFSSILMQDENYVQEWFRQKEIKIATQ